MLSEAEVPKVTKERNPANAPQSRPVEDFLGVLKQEVFKGDRIAKSDHMLRKHIQQCVRKNSLDLPRKMMDGVAKRVRLADRVVIETLI